MSFSVGLLSEPSLATDDIHLESKLQSCLSSDMAEKTLTSDGFLTTTKEQALINETDDIYPASRVSFDLPRQIGKIFLGRIEGDSARRVKDMQTDFFTKELKQAAV